MISTLLGRTTLRSPCGHDMDNLIIEVNDKMVGFDTNGRRKTACQMKY